MQCELIHARGRHSEIKTRFNRESVLLMVFPDEEKQSFLLDFSVGGCLGNSEGFNENTEGCW